GALVGGNREDRADRGGQRVGLRRRGARHRQPEAPEIAVLVVVAVPAAVVLLQEKDQDRAALIGDGLLGDEDRLARMVAAARADVDAPGGLVLAVDRERHRAG